MDPFALLTAGAKFDRRRYSKDIQAFNPKAGTEPPGTHNHGVWAMSGPAVGAWCTGAPTTPCRASLAALSLVRCRIHGAPCMRTRRLTPNSPLPFPFPPSKTLLTSAGSAAAKEAELAAARRSGAAGSGAGGAPGQAAAGGQSGRARAKANARKRRKLNAAAAARGSSDPDEGGSGQGRKARVSGDGGWGPR